MGMVVHRFDVWLVMLDPTVGSEIQKTRPALVVSPDELNAHVATVIIAPMTTKGREYPTRAPCSFQGKVGAGRARSDPHRGQDTPRETAGKPGPLHKRCGPRYFI